MNVTLIRTLIDVIVFLEFSDEQEVGLDTAVNVLEDITASLANLSEEEKEEFMRVAEEYAVSFSNSDTQDFIRSREKLLGLI